MSPQEYVANQARKNRKPVTQCPYGCEADEANGRSYCRHLVGWTLDGENVDLRITNKDGTIDIGATGIKQRLIDLDVDMIVTTQTPTSRVYQSLGDQLVDQTAKNLDEVAALKRQVAEQDRQMAELRAMIEDKADKKKKTEPVPA